MPTWSRRRIETLGLAALAIVAVTALRIGVESRYWFLAELGTLCIAFVVGEFTRTCRLAGSTTAVLVFTPIVFAIAARAFGSPIAFEMSTLATVGAIALAMASAATTNRVRGLSLVLSGFLVLFCAAISDNRYAAVVPLIWMLGCVWHLIANHWERLDLAMPDSVQRNWSLRPGILLAAMLVLAAGGYAVKDRLTSSGRLEIGLMPTSGGSQWSDPAARSGVGTGDAAIAAKDHAESFGAVDSDLFLESTEPTLFDMFNDMIGEPKKKNNKSERAQAMGNENFIPSHQRNAKSEQGGGTFSTERTRPKKHVRFKDAKEASVVQWDGPTGIRLAMHRYDTFDGRDWSQSADWNNMSLNRVDINDTTWFFDPLGRAALSGAPDATSVGLLKIIRLDSPRLPVPMMTAGVHIKQIDRQDFFGITPDGCFFMPGREKVPPLTVVHAASINLTEDAIRAGLKERVRPQPQHPGIGELSDRIVADQTVSFDKLQSIVNHLRTEFTFTRDGDAAASSLTEFLQSRRGGDHLFATTAALMARQIGLSSRLVTGFYVRPDAFDITAGHASVLPQDVHVWAEVQLQDGRWFEIEPTPGFRQPHYKPSWTLLARRFAAASWPIIVGGAVALVCVYLTRCVWIDWLLAAAWSQARWLRPRRRLRLAIRIIETRARLAGQRRPIGKSQRAWLEQLTHADATLASAARQFSDAADVLFFGAGNPPSKRDATALVDLLRVRTINALTKEATS
ncbi:Transglutaminase-like superfamily protein [Stieleria neptunia]|uniref:Transglutaminase-like superfamily protein n=1 Tax=Stieleria neptunia TaxID=2527979 RepID=A0A518HUJ5_9BACT|nr:transglutaminase-like domain-containing protein [Stieleria neptunia]QDV44484.1 Transglutaminase-like superfamily protein [Stieleria neptunia]